MESSLILFSIIVILVSWLFRKILKDGTPLEAQGIPHDRPLPFVGNSLPLLLKQDSPIDQMEKQYKKFADDNLFGTYEPFGTYHLTLKHPALLKQMMIKDFESYVNRGSLEKGLGRDQLLGRSVLLMHNQEWKDMRTMLSPIYTSSKMKYMFNLLTECTEEFITHHEMRALKNEGITEIETQDVFARVTVDGIFTTALGFKGDCVINESSKMYHVIDEVQEDFKAMFTEKRFFRKSIHDFFVRSVLDEMSRRKEGKIVRPDVIQLLVQALEGRLKLEAGDAEELTYTDTKVRKIINWSDQDLVSQAFVLFLGGFETTTTLMQTLTYELTQNLEYQETLHAEVEEMLAKLDGRQISYDELNQMKFLEMVVNETLRKWPSFRVVSRVCTKDTVLYDEETGKNYKIKKGITVMIPIRFLHMDPRFFPEPEVFDPYRFSEENKHKIQSGSFIPFGMGPRVCIGMRYAMLEAKLLVFRLISKFSIEKSDRTPGKVTNAPGNTGYNEKIYLNLKLRN